MMKDNSKPLDLEKKISKGLKLAYKKMLEFKKQKNSNVVIFRDGKVIEVEPEELLSKID